MRRGTTPTNIFNANIDLTGATAIYVTYQQYNKTVIEKTIDDVTIDGEVISVPLTQIETLNLIPDVPVRIQVRAVLQDGNRVTSNILSTNVETVLKEGEI